MYQTISPDTGFDFTVLFARSVFDWISCTCGTIDLASLDISHIDPVLHFDLWNSHAGTSGTPSPCGVFTDWQLRQPWRVKYTLLRNTGTSLALATSLLRQCAPAQVDLSTTPDFSPKTKSIPLLLGPIALPYRYFPIVQCCCILTLFLGFVLSHFTKGSIVHWLTSYAQSSRSTQPDPTVTAVASDVEAPSSRKSGPKSGHSWLPQFRRSYCLVLLLWIWMSFYIDARNGGEGFSTESCSGKGADFGASDLERFFQAKFHDTAPQIGPGQICPVSLRSMNSVQKRSLQRAYRHATQHGSAWYRGRCLLPVDFPPSLHAAPSPRRQNSSHKTVFVPSLNRAPRSRMQVVHLNVGGLSASRLEEIKTWAIATAQDILVLSETRWSFESEWTDNDWLHIHTGTPDDRADGLLFAIRKTVCDCSRIGFAVLKPGRIAHIRFHFARRALDLFGCYQYADTRTTQRNRQRAEFWTVWDHSLQTLPRRNSFLLCGDMNCSLRQDGIHVGTDLFQWQSKLQQGPSHHDMPRLHQLLVAHDLVALNTWNAQYPPTYQNKLTASRIDHFLMRRSESDERALDVKFYQDIGFLPLRGAHHVPMMCSIRKIPYHKPPQQRISSCTYQQRLQCRSDWTRNSQTWRAFLQDWDIHWNRFVTKPINPDTVIDDMHSSLMPIFQTHFPKCQPTGPAMQPDKPLFQSKWRHKQALLQITAPTCRNVLRAWFHASRFATLKRQQQRIAKERKRQRIHDLLSEVDNAAATHDSFRVFQAVHRFTPKNPHKRIRIRNADGSIATPQEVLDLTKQHVLSVWAGPETLQYLCDQPPGVPFALDELVQEIQHIPVVKSVARPCLPGLCWKAHALSTARFIFDLLQDWWNRQNFHIPKQWRQAWLTFIHTPSKSPDRLSHLRPLALQEPIGKCVLGLLNKKLVLQLRPLLAPWPQFSFSQFRSPLDAIRRVVCHCQCIRQLIGSVRRTAHQRALDLHTYTVCGGLQMIVDVHQAFDRVPRQPLFSYLARQGVDQGLLALIAEWHCQTEYILWHEQCAHAIPTGRGVRQGCRMAPTLWLSYTLALMQEISSRTSEQWVKDHVTLFADDIHTGEAFYSKQQLLDSIRKLGCLLDALEYLGLSVSLDKTFVILHICGTNCRSIRKQVIRQDAQGQYIEVPRAHGHPTRLRVKIAAKYLGVQISYHNIEMLTMKTRLKAAQHNFQRLKRWLCSKRIRIKCRLQMWHSCVFMSMVYGLFAVDLTLPTILQPKKSFLVCTEK